MKSRKTVWRWLAVVSVLVLVVCGAVAGAWWWTTQHTFSVARPAAVSEASASFLSPDAQSASPNISAAVQGFSDDPALGELSAHVTDAVTGQVLWEKNAESFLVPASVTKLVTAGAALSVLPSDAVVTTRVVEEAPGQLVLVGGGDVTLTDKPGGGFYTDAASVQDLADQVATALQGRTVTSIRVGNSIREGSVFNDTWDPEDVEGGNVADVDSVMLDGGRVDPSDSYSPRSSSPAEDVARSLAAQLGAEDVQISVDDQPAAAEAQELGSVTSAPLEVRVRDMLVHSDNVLAEAIGREVAEARGLPHTFEGATRATIETLSDDGLSMDGVVLKDNSGMSEKNRLNARVLDSLLASETFRPLLDALPVSSVEGTLSHRYEEGSGAEASAGYVRAKTGTLDGVNALAGTVMTEDGRPLTFAFLSNDSSPDEARPALDRLANALHTAA
ncbi:D-alanyl-D-alanine carboxypeptidase/D-alanyl-D-alanine-endopeptidase [Corynebacterium sp. zg254]|uniref:D-alanyl-D-alanine carboxypeptidase/D-alanyl-D-alanine-endopeptidase n=1 Tax=Corynebacterium zhongnanshanii TaxID=2768834 RepID=A0ABQ6VCA5_9CORY|nr:MULTISPECIES: D-alanyl-D-alanine carboxypeptidase/D-alanyl-D-alanine-endopeptidase [Corynebacterium]KAB3519862.1 D-alanyl-D-alanine carboxypeptidase/D-alanyl-D-alanine-endopeptidase [Corynebacterium zhongnanshanii]MCR5914801.1 D-alanyl-D-alanine carboxypeptidase/D-alanyl-D-alanine-endopeptidase [Corynebacterium sp. zg254]